MKKLIFILITIALIIALSCKEESAVQMGCQTGIYKGSNVRVTIRCCTEREHQAGNNTAAGGTASFTYFSNVQWSAIDDCKNCK